MKGKFDVGDVELDEFLKGLTPGDRIEIYTDGSCLGNPGPGGWGAIFVFRDKRSCISGFEKMTTNNRMELRAAIEAIKAMPDSIEIILYTDSSYVKNGITSWVKTWLTNNWKSASGAPVKNQDFWKELAALTEDRTVNWKWVKGHSDCANNNNADFVARSAIVGAYMKDDLVSD
ncbi:MAG: ribonuclease HI [Holosporales bacterium]|nr:ribonuclease HI [Holosporales bacterium]